MTVATYRFNRSSALTLIRDARARARAETTDRFRDYWQRQVRSEQRCLAALRELRPRLS